MTAVRTVEKVSRSGMRPGFVGAERIEVEMRRTVELQKTVGSVRVVVEGNA